MTRSTIALFSICVAGLLAGCGARQAVTVNSKKQYEYQIRAGVNSVIVLNDYRVDDHRFRTTAAEPTTLTIQTKGGGDIFYVASSTSMTSSEHAAKTIMATIGICLADTYPLVFGENVDAREQRIQRMSDLEAKANREETEIEKLNKEVKKARAVEDKRAKEETAASKATLAQFLSRVGQLPVNEQKAILAFLFPLQDYADIAAFRTAALPADSKVSFDLLMIAKEYRGLAGTDDPKPGMYGDKIEKFQVRESYDVGTLQVSALWVPKSSVYSAAHITVRPFADISTWEKWTNFLDRFGVDVGMAATGIGGSSTEKLEDTIGLMSGVSFKITNGFGIGCGNLMLIPKDSASGDTTNRFYASATIDVLKIIDMVSKQSVAP